MKSLAGDGELVESWWMVESLLGLDGWWRAWWKISLLKFG